MSAQASAGLHGAAVTEGPEYETDPELALAAALQLLSRFPSRGSPALAHAIASHFRVIGSDPRLSAGLRECAARLVRDCEAYAVLSEADDLSQGSRVLH